jgi:hypothetical protein
MVGINENTRGQDIPANLLSAARKRALYTTVDKSKTSQETLDYGKYLQQYFNPAVKFAEGHWSTHANSLNPGSAYGVLSEKVSGPKEANTVLDNSILNNFIRWINAGRPGTFVDFFRDRWAPIGALNDPNSLNANWNNAVRKSLKKQLGDETYNKWEQLNLVKNNSSIGGDDVKV